MHTIRMMYPVMLLAALMSQPARSDNPVAAGATAVNANEAKALFDRGARFVDVRLPEVREAAGHIPRSLALGAKFDVDATPLLRFAGRRDEVVFYCSNADCVNDYYAGEKARELGYSRVYQLRGGFDGWRASGLPVER